MNRMEQTLTQNGDDVEIVALLFLILKKLKYLYLLNAYAGYQSNLSSANPRDQLVELPSNVQGLPTLEALSTVLHRAEQLLGGQAVAALSVINTSHLLIFMFTLMIKISFYYLQL